MKVVRLFICLFALFITTQANAQTLPDVDFDASGTVDFPDFLMFARAFGSTEALYDLDNSGTVDFPDFLLFTQAFGGNNSSSPTTPDPTPITTLTEVDVTDVPADTSAVGAFTFFSLRDSTIVSSADSNSTKWDIAFKGTTVILNGGTSGPGQAAAIVLADTDYNGLSTAPESGYTQDQEGLPVIKGWYTYTGPTGTPPHAILMNDGVVIVIRTADGNYAKLKFTSYYKGGEAVPSSGAQSRFYNFTYTYQPDGSRTVGQGSSNTSNTTIQTLTEVMVKDVPADTGSVGAFTFFSLRDSTIVSSADSNSTNWDIAFKSTTVILNGGSSGPGQAAAIVLAATDYDTLSTAPESGFIQDQTGLPAISGWYTYTGSEGFPPHSILMNPGIVLVIRTADGKYAKLKFTSYYEGGEAVPSGDAKARFYNFTYTYQPDGSNNLK